MPNRSMQVIGLHNSILTSFRYSLAHLFLRTGDLDLDLDLDLLPLPLHEPAYKHYKISKVHLLDCFTCMFLVMLIGWLRLKNIKTINLRTPNKIPDPFTGRVRRMPALRVLAMRRPRNMSKNKKITG